MKYPAVRMLIIPYLRVNHHDKILFLSHYLKLDSVLLCVFECSIPRLTNYLPEESKAILTSHHASVQYHVPIQTTFVEPFDPIIGAQYIVLGEIEKPEGMYVVFSLCIFPSHTLCNQTTPQSCLSPFYFQGMVKPLCVRGSLIVWTASMLHCYRRP